MPKIMQICAIDTTMKTLLGELNRSTVRNGYITIGVCSRGNHREQIESDGVSLISIQIDRKVSISNIKSVYELYKLIRTLKPDIVHVHTPIAAVLGRIAAKLAGVPSIIYTAHGFYFHENMKPLAYKTTYLIEKLMARLFTHYIFTQSQEDAQLAVDSKFLPKDRILCISNGVDVAEKFNPVRINQVEINKLYEEFDLSKENKIITFIGRIVKEKGIFDLLEAFSRIRKDNVKLLIIGGQAQGDRDISAIDKIDSYKNNPNIIFTGNRVDINNLLYISDIFCLPSYREGMPRSIIEAMAMENAIIATNIRGSREEVIDGKTGFLVPLNDPVSIAEKIMSLLENEVLLRSMQRSGRERAFKYYNEQEVVLKQIEVFNKLVKKNTKGDVEFESI